MLHNVVVNETKATFFGLTFL